MPMEYISGDEMKIFYKPSEKVSDRIMEHTRTKDAVLLIFYDLPRHRCAFVCLDEAVRM